MLLPYTMPITRGIATSDRLLPFILPYCPSQLFGHADRLLGFAIYDYGHNPTRSHQVAPFPLESPEAFVPSRLFYPDRVPIVIVIVADVPLVAAVSVHHPNLAGATLMYSPIDDLGAIG